MDSTAIEKIQKTANIPALLKHVEKIDTHIPLAVVPDGFTLKNIEDKQEYLSRYRMRYDTTSINDYLDYGSKFAQPGGTCFVDAKKMCALTIFDLGTVEKPLHKSHVSALSLEKTAIFKALLIVDGQKLSQKEAANFIEDWADNLSVDDKSGDSMTNAHAVNALQNLTIEAARSLNSQVDDYGESMSAMEKIEAKNKESLPSLIKFQCVPYHHLSLREFHVRLSVLTSGEKPMISLRIVKLEQMEEDIAEEFKSMLVAGFADSELDVYMGNA